MDQIQKIKEKNISKIEKNTANNFLKDSIDKLKEEIKKVDIAQDNLKEEIKSKDWEDANCPTSHH